LSPPQRATGERNTAKAALRFFPDGTGLWVIQAETLEEAQAIVNNSSCRTRDSMLADSAADRGVASAY
jgi:uncharacterized protein YciI